MQMNKSMLREYQDRWRAVAEIEATEQRQSTAAQRWKKLNSLIRMAAALGLLRKNEDEQVDAVRQRWNLLKKIYLTESQRQIE